MLLLLLGTWIQRLRTFFESLLCDKRMDSSVWEMCGSVPVMCWLTAAWNFWTTWSAELSSGYAISFVRQYYLLITITFISLAKLQNCIYQDHSTAENWYSKKFTGRYCAVEKAHKSYKYIRPAVHFIQHNTNTNVRMLLTAPTLHESQKRANF